MKRLLVVAASCLASIYSSACAPPDTPLTPHDEAGHSLGWANTTLLDGITYVANHDSVVFTIPTVAGAKDFRAFRLPDGVEVSTDFGGGEDVKKTVVHCAGNEQHNDEVAAQPVVMQRLEVHGITATTKIVIEAIDALCPFPGVHGSAHKTLTIDNVTLPSSAKHPFDVYTESEIVQEYGSLIVNGQGTASSDTTGGSTSIGLRAPKVSPRVLGRNTIEVTPTGTAPDQVSSFFDSFDDDTDQPTAQSNLPDVSGRGQFGRLLTSTNWGFYTWGAADPAGSGLSQFFIERGRLHSVIADWAQEIFSTNSAVPKRTFQLSNTDYLHAHFEVASNTSARRYWWFWMCGAPTVGQTLDTAGVLKTRIVQTSFFYQDDALNPTMAGWNCFQMFPLDGSPFPLGTPSERPESDLRIIINMANSPDPNRTNVRRVMPNQYGNENIAPKGWYRQRNASGQLGAPVLDDEMRMAPRAVFDLYLRRDRAILYVNGQQRVCNDFPNQALTMAEGAVGFSNVLYHTAAEHEEFSLSFNDRTGQLHYLNNTPFIDERTWDNLGLQENVSAPAGFDPAPCFVAP